MTEVILVKKLPVAIFFETVRRLFAQLCYLGKEFIEL